MKDEDLLQMLQENPKEGIRFMIKQYGGLIRAVTWRRLAGKFPKEDLEECISDIFFEFYQNVEKIDLNKGSVKVFLLTIAERKAIKYYRSLSKEPGKTNIDEMQESMLGDEMSPEIQMLQKERNEHLMEALQQLGEPTCGILIRKYYYGMTAKEIGKTYNLSKNAVEKRIKRGLMKLKDMLGGAINGDED